MSIFLLEFEKLYAQLVKNDCRYPDAVLAYKVLMGANLSVEHERLCKATVTTVDWTYDAMKTQIKKIFCDFTPENVEVADRPIKVEPTLFARKPRNSPSKHSSDEYSGFEEEEYSDEDYDDGRTTYKHYEVRRSNSNMQEQDIYYGSSNIQERDVYYGRNKNYNFNRRSPRNSSFNGKQDYNRQPSCSEASKYQEP